jgi:hypothetical protein
MKITSLNYNWRPVVREYSDGYGGKVVDSTCDFDNYTVGSTYFNGQDKPRKTCIAIKEPPAAGEGDKWYYDIMFDDDTSVREFNPNEVFYEKN